MHENKGNQAMLFIIYCLDKPGAAPTRATTMPAHREYTAACPDIVLSGPITTDDGSEVIGSFFMVEAADRGAVERFQQGDPLYRAGIWASTDVRAFAKRVDNRK